jgi:hypothetical protein
MRLRMRMRIRMRLRKQYCLQSSRGLNAGAQECSIPASPGINYKKRHHKTLEETQWHTKRTKPSKAKIIQGTFQAPTKVAQ